MTNYFFGFGLGVIGGFVIAFAVMRWAVSDVFRKYKESMAWRHQAEEESRNLRYANRKLRKENARIRRSNALNRRSHHGQ